MHVLQDDQQRPLQGRVAQQSRGGSLDVRRAQRHRSPHRLLLQLGQQPTNVGKPAAGHRIEPADAQRAAQVADDVQEGTERHVAAAGRGAVTLKDAHVTPAELVDELVHETGLADAGLTQHQRSAGLATGCRRRHPLQRRQLNLSPDHARAHAPMLTPRQSRGERPV